MTRNPPRPQLTLAIIKFALIDVVGMLLLAIGLAYLVQGPGAFFASFPSTQLEALALTAAGVVVMGYAATRILREVMRQQGRLEE
jgi:membrane protein DedA with SNARE-associated domain